MQKWEYIIAEYTVGGMKLQSINGVSQLGNGLLPKYPSLVEYLKQIGEEGWEIVGMSNSGGATSNFIAKRPKP